MQSDILCLEAMLRADAVWVGFLDFGFSTDLVYYVFTG
jgi:hypothetical protein